MLDIIYTISNQEKTISIDNHPSQQWLYLDKLTLHVGDQMEIDDQPNNIYHHLRLFQKKLNVHIFSGISHIEEKYTVSIFGYFLVWVDNTNSYCFIQNNQKVPNIRDKRDNISLPQEYLENLFKGLFFTLPIYYLNTNSRCKGINNISDLPEPIKSQVVEENNDADIPFKQITYCPI